jgi:hypothetical protein
MAIQALATGMEPGFSLFAEQMPAYLRTLIGGSAWRLSLSRHPADALPFLTAMLDDVSAAEAPSAKDL